MDQDRKVLLDNANNILRILHDHPEDDGMRAEDVRSRLSGQSKEQVDHAVGLLVDRGRLRIFQEGEHQIFKALSSEEAAKFKGLTPQERIIHGLIENEGDKGIWLRRIKRNSRLPQSTVASALRTLMDRRLIKQVQSKGAKVYLLFDLEPSEEIVGNVLRGPGREYDSEFISILGQQCFLFIKKHPYTNLNAVAEFIKSGGWCQVALRLQDVESVVNALIFDGKVERVVDTSAETHSLEAHYLYKVNRLPTVSTGFTEVPCGNCPVFSQCSEDSAISPQSCTHMKAWLAQDW